MDWTFYLDDLEIEQPIGFDELTIRMKRDDVWHGVFFEASTSDLGFYGEAADYLIDKKNQEGFAADVTFRAVVDCGGEDEVFRGRIDIRQMNISCGADCIVTAPVEEISCLMTLRNRYDQKVDIASNKAFDKITNLEDYVGLNFEQEYTSQHLSKRDTADTHEQELFDIRGSSAWVPNADGGTTIRAYLFPGFGHITNSSLGTFSPYETILMNVGGSPDVSPPPGATIPILAIGDDGVSVSCELQGVTFDFRWKGRIEQTTSGASVTVFLLNLFRLPGGADELDPFAYELVQQWPIGELDGDSELDFDIEDSVPITAEAGDQFYFGIQFSNFLNALDVDSLTLRMDTESYVDIPAVGVCPPTDAVSSLVHELASRITEAITDRCLTVKSDYYGRTDSQPYAAATDGCGSLRVLTSGLRLRQAENPTHFLSLKQLFDGLNAIDNIGMGVEGDQLRIEPVEYFYQNRKVMRLRAIPKAMFSVDERLAYGLIKIGYKKWETENLNGLDEFNSNKEFRTSLKTITNEIDQTSLFVAGGYPIELTRQQSFALTGAADTTYDNETFIACVKRTAYAYEIEKDIIEDADGMFSPETCYNWRIRPMYNLMRWWKTLAASYVNLSSTVSKLFFSSGTGNLLAEGQLNAYDDCKVEAVVKSESDDLARADMQVGQDPLWKAETLKFTYPISILDYNTLKADPYGYIEAECGRAEAVKGFLTEMLYKPAKGEADITLRLKWDIQ